MNSQSNSEEQPKSALVSPSLVLANEKTEASVVPRTKLAAHEGSVNWKYETAGLWLCDALRFRGCDIAPLTCRHGKASQRNPVSRSLALLGAFPDLPVSRYSLYSMTPHPGLSLCSRTITIDPSQYPVLRSLASLGAFPDLPVSRYLLRSITPHPGFSLGSTSTATGFWKYEQLFSGPCECDTVRV